MAETPRLRRDLPFRRIAVVLSGGGALGAYEVGVLKVLEQLALRPDLVAGVSIGAVNAIVWTAHGGRTAALEAAWRRMRGSHIGLHWMTLALRLAGIIAVSIGLLEFVLTFAGTRALSGSYWLWRKWSGRVDMWSAQLDAVAWCVVVAAGLLVLLSARRIERWLSEGPPFAESTRGRHVLGRVTLVLAAVHTLVWVMGWPWPHRFSATLLLLLTGMWLSSSPGRTGDWMRRITLGLMPETRGRGLWSGIARRRVVEQLVQEGDPRRLTGEGTGLIVSALAVDSGRVCHFVSWPQPGGEFVTRVKRELGEVVTLRSPSEMIDAVVASSAIPGVFEPVRIAERDFVDAGGFSNQPLHVALANGADAVLCVLMTPSGTPPPTAPPSDLMQLAGRLLELANWRDLQAELRELPEGFARTGSPARVCVVEPLRPLPGSVLGFEPDQSGELIALGEADAWRARTGGRCYTASNQEHHRIAYLREHKGLGDHFDEIVYSAALGVCKPDRVFFTNAQARMGVTAAQAILFVDDTPGNVDGARMAGWRAMLYRGRASLAAALEKWG